MRIDLFKDVNANADNDTGWVNLASNLGLRKLPQSTSITVSYKSIILAGGTVDGTIQILASNSLEETKEDAIVLETFTVTTGADTNIHFILGAVQYIKLVYTKNSVNSGKLNCFLATEVD